MQVDIPGPEQKLPVTVLTGFLGAGKTTLLSRMLASPDMANTAVIINEFGEIGLDHDLVETGGEEGIVTLSSGCLCCTVRGDLVRTMHDLYGRMKDGRVRPFKRVVIETTGLADPAPILQTLMQDAAIDHFFRLEGVITLVDAVNGADTLDRHEEAVKQAAVADRIVLTKADLASKAATDALAERLRRLNPAAPIFPVEHGRIDPGQLLDAGLYDARTKSVDVQRWLAEEAYGGPHGHHHGHQHGDHDHHHGHAHDHAHRHDAGAGQDPHNVNRHDEHIRAFAIRMAEPIPAAAFSLFLDLLTAQRGADLLRVKGIVHIAEEPDRPLVFHAVQHVMHPPVTLDRWPSDDRDTRLVFIVRDLDKGQVESLLAALARAHADLGGGG
ncbi:MAG TPA: GTP-binding protein [Geminicoccus sp.]|jgi:G3E family GTPase|uniref:CobW family GTP-binding protein n=1 Tax=Geminicoccus sp. TaxID=2024832 RepID=UPI002E351AA3|nr:GTP-binding protein [Geminicoccus sp.]HEX2526027.1 GTP-binding protein [Geminicoccus sp.]